MTILVKVWGKSSPDDEERTNDVVSLFQRQMYDATIIFLFFNPLQSVVPVDE